MFRKATRQQSKLRMTIDGPAGSGKTYTALRFAHALAGPAGRIALIDTERGSASKYVGDAPDGISWSFDVLELKTFSPEKYTEAIQAAGTHGYSVLVIDSLSHAWEGVGGALEIKQRLGESWSAWRHVTPIHNRMIDAILQSPCHVITTMRSRMEYVQEQDTNGKTVIRKVGLSPIQRPGMEYEFDIVADIDYAHIMTVSKSRCTGVADRIVERPGPDFMNAVLDWLSSGEAAREPEFTAAELEKAVSEPAIPETGLQVPDLTVLMDRFGVDAILAANGGSIPGSEIELISVAALLEVQ